VIVTEEEITHGAEKDDDGKAEQQPSSRIGSHTMLVEGGRIRADQEEKSTALMWGNEHLSTDFLLKNKPDDFSRRSMFSAENDLCFCRRYEFLRGCPAGPLLSECLIPVLPP
jgi:hypothetical protein